MRLSIRELAADGADARDRDRPREELTPAEAPDTCSKLGAASALLIICGFRRVDRVRRQPAVPLDILGFVTVPFFYMVTRAGGSRWKHEGGDERHREVADPLGAVGHRGQLIEYPVVRLSFMIGFLGPRLRCVPRRILRLVCATGVWSGLSSFTRLPPRVGAVVKDRPWSE